ncbi:MAG: phosphate ABC transporter permease PstA, partial [Burkholderiales bacterium]
MTLHGRRKLVNRIALALSLGAMGFGLFWLLWILFEVVRLGFGGLSLDLFTKMTPAPGSEGGLLNAIVGSLILVGMASFVGTP